MTDEPRPPSPEWPETVQRWAWAAGVLGVVLLGVAFAIFVWLTSVNPLSAPQVRPFTWWEEAAGRAVGPLLFGGGTLFVLALIASGVAGCVRWLRGDDR